MKKITKSLGALALVATMGMAQPSFYAGGGLAFESLPDAAGTDNGMGIVLRGGATLDSVLKNFGVEAELTKSVADPKLWGADMNVLTLASYAVYNIKIKRFYVKPRFGIILPNLGDDTNSRDLGFSSGIGGGFALTKKMNVYVDYTILGESVSNWGAGVEYKF